ncbi:hypothetical protein C8J57DRAFT_1523495 [Mycena rebaudengoi]|nr:hypothetical protein C8J57DRAFT_1523495 [Mycena rebaudengoi]
MFGALVVMLSAILPFATAQKGTFTNIADPVGVVQCLPYTFQWTGGEAPWEVTVESTLGEHYLEKTMQTNSLTWTPEYGVNATADTPVRL